MPYSVFSFGKLVVVTEKQKIYYEVKVFATPKKKWQKEMLVKHSKIALLVLLEAPLNIKWNFELKCESADKQIPFIIKAFH